MPTFERLDYGSPDGSQWGTVTSDRLGYYGVTPVVQQSIGLGLSTDTHASTLISSVVAACKLIGLFQT